MAPPVRRYYVGAGGRPTLDAFPPPGEARVAAPAWIETTTDLLRTAGYPAGGIPTGLLVKHTTEFWPTGHITVRFVIAPKSFLPVVLPLRVLVDPNGYDDEGRLGFADFLREREGIPTAASASRSQLLQMYDHVKMVDDRLLIRVPAGPGATPIRANLEWYSAASRHGFEGLKAALAATVIQVDERAFRTNDDAEAKALRLLVDYAIGRADFAALDAMRLAARRATLN